MTKPITPIAHQRRREELQRQIDEYLANGGTIKKAEPDQRKPVEPPILNRQQRAKLGKAWEEER